MTVALRERDWEGDDVLADQLDALLGSGVMPDLRPLPVDLDELADILEGDPVYGGGRVDLATGEVWPAPAVDYAREIGQEDEDESEDPDKWLGVNGKGSRDSYGTWSCSSERCVIQVAPTAWRSPFPDEERSGGSRMS
jgi:hypothetical protein